MKTFALAILILLLTAPTIGQDDPRPELQRHSWDVFIKRDAANAEQSELIFIDLLSGEESTLAAIGERFTLTDSGVIFFDPLARQVKLAKADGIVRDHPFIKFAADGHHIEWAVTPDRSRIVWSASRRQEDGRLISATWLADVAGVEIRELLVYGPREGVKLLPVGFGGDQREVFMEAQVEGSAGWSLYRRRAGLFGLRLVEDELVTRTLPGDQACFCAAAFGANLMLRLLPNRESQGLDVEITHLESGERQVVPALSRGKTSEGGNILISADGKRAVYAVTQLPTDGEGDEYRSALILVDIENGRQRIAASPIPGLPRPLSFTDENRAALFTTQQDNGAWKVDLEDGRLVKVADAIYLGAIGEG